MRTAQIGGRGPKGLTKVRTCSHEGESLCDTVTSVPTEGITGLLNNWALSFNPFFCDLTTRHGPPTHITTSAREDLKGFLMALKIWFISNNT